jgi:ribosome-associated protein
MFKISPTVSIPETDLEFRAVRSQGAGGQNVNKVASAIHLRFDIPASSLPEYYKQRLLSLHDQRITKDGVIIIKAQEFRSQEQNREAALDRLKELMLSAFVVDAPRKPTLPSKTAEQRRLDSKTRRSQLKAHRGNITDALD